MRPTEFICLLFKLLLLKPEMDIVLAYLQQEDWKYLRALAAIYIRLTAKSEVIYEHLETVIKTDYRKLRYRNSNRSYSLTFMDEFIDNLLHGDRVCDTILPYFNKKEMEFSDLESSSEEEVSTLTLLAYTFFNLEQ
jgi:pre-mRNA-splicing factor 38A